MLKKIIILAVLGGIGYVGYLVWTEHLSESDKTTIKKKLSATGKKIKKGTSKLAKEAADVVKDGLKDDKQKKDSAAEDDDKEPSTGKENEEASSEDQGREQDE